MLTLTLCINVLRTFSANSLHLDSCGGLLNRWDSREMNEWLSKEMSQSFSNLGLQTAIYIWHLKSDIYKQYHPLLVPLSSSRKCPQALNCGTATLIFFFNFNKKHIFVSIYKIFCFVSAKLSILISPQNIFVYQFTRCFIFCFG